MVRRTTILRRGNGPIAAPLAALLLMAAGLLRAGEPAAQSSPSADLAAGKLVSASGSASDVEAELIARRKERFKLLAAPPAPPKADTPTNNAIDQFIAAGWLKYPAPSGAPEPALCDDTTFCRRVHLDLIGVIPSML